MKEKVAFVLVVSGVMALMSIFRTSGMNESVIGSVRRTSTFHDETSILPQAPRRQRLGDGCYHVFLDVGANVGVHGRFLFEPDAYNETRFAVDLFQQEYGATRDNRDFCVFAFEPNPAHKQRLQEVSDAYKKLGWRFEYIPAGIGDEDGNMTFYHLHDTRFNEWGFTTMRNKDPLGFPGQEEIVPVIRLARWLEEEIHNRVIPAATFGQYNRSETKVVMKFDIEGLEYVVLPDLITSGALCNTVDLVFGEFHRQEFFFPLRFPKHGLILRNKEEAREYADGLMKLIQISQSCKTRYDTRDDESYLRDSIPLPYPS